jgi:multiple sugar transport system permease protein
MAAMTPERKARIAELQAESTRQILGSTLSVKKASRFTLPEAAKAWIALIPALIFLILFMMYPILNTFLISFMENFTFVGGSGSSFAITNFIAALNNRRVIDPSIGFGNYITVMTDQQFLTAIGNTALMVIVSVPLTIIIALLIAVLLNAIKPLRGFFQTVFFLPYVTNTIALGMVFRVIFSSSGGGLINSIFFGGNVHAWLTAQASRWAMFLVIVVYAVWNGLAFKILVFQGGLASIDKQYYDAAKIDGASRSTIFRRVTVPLLAPEMLYITITSFIGAFKAYTQVISLFGAGSTNFGGSTGREWITVVGYVYLVMQDPTKVGRAASASFVLLLIILIITLFQTLANKRKVKF